MFGGRLKAIIDGKDRELEIIITQLESATREVAHLRLQLDRVYEAALGLGSAKPRTVTRPQSTRGMSDNGVG